MPPKVAVPLALFWVIAPAWAEDVPPAEFWQYLLEYGNEQGEVLDPLDFDKLTKISDQAAPSSSEKPAAPPVQKEKDQ